MRVILKVSKIWIPAFLLALSNGRVRRPGHKCWNGESRPSVSARSGLCSSGGRCDLHLPGVVVTATFSKAMNPSTIDTGTFKLAAGAAAVTGTVALDSTDTIATFTPSSPLAVNTPYTGTITTGAKDQFGNALAANFVWMFTTASTACPGPIALGSACTFGILAATPSVTNTGATHVTGDVGIWPAASITGFPPGTLTGTEHTGDAVAQTAQGDLTTAYNAAAGAPGGAALTADIGGQTLAPGVYKTTSTLGITGNLTLMGAPIRMVVGSSRLGPR